MAWRATRSRTQSRASVETFHMRRAASRPTCAAILSWLVAFNVINTHNDFMRTFLRALDRMTEPLYRPFRRILPDFGGLDFSPMIVLLLIIMLKDYMLPAALLSVAQ